LLERKVNKRDKQTVYMPDGDAVQRQRKERNTPGAADQDEGVAGREQCGVATRENQIAYYAEQEANKMIFLDFGCDHHITWKAYCAVPCYATNVISMAVLLQRRR
jgi:hypothetical protein